tara:strand:+ start:786 stop:953 length:168 start_codon:yes stop_codon:yes gene_type:complete
MVAFRTSSAQYQKFKLAASEAGKSGSAILRECIDQYLNQHKAAKREAEIMRSFLG